MTAPEDDPPAATPMLDRRDWLIAGALLPLAFAFGWATGQAGAIEDSWRDLYFAWRIVAGEGLPASGPVIGNIAHLGPLWYYLLAPAFWLGGAEGMLGLVGGLAGLTPALAYLVGRLALDRRYGLLLAAALLAPGWSMFALLWPTHTSAVMLALLALAGGTLGYRRAPGGGRAAVLGVLASLAVHAHPTTLLLAGCLVAFALLAARSRWTRLRHALVVVLVAALPLLPHLLAQLGGSGQDLPQLQRYVGEQLQGGILERLWPLTRGIAWGGPVMVHDYLLHGRASALLLAAHAGGLLLAAIGLALLPRGLRRWALLLALAWLAQSLFLLLLRPISPFWMSYAHLPLLAALVALGWHALWQALPAVRFALLAVAASHLAGWGLLLQVLVDPPVAYRHPTFAPGSAGMLSVTSVATGATTLSTARLPAQRMQALGARLCTPTSVYGHLAAWADESFGVGIRMACGRSDQLALGGPPAARAWIGLIGNAQRAAGLPEGEREGGLQLYPASAVWTRATPLPIVEGGRFPPRQLEVSAGTFTVSGRAPASAVVVISARASGYVGFEPGEVRADDRPVAPLYRDRYLALYRCTDCSADAEIGWRLTAVSAEAYTDVVVIDPADALR